MSRKPNEEGLRKVLGRLDKDNLNSVGYGKPASLMEDFPVLREYIAVGLDVQKAAQRVWCEKYNCELLRVSFNSTRSVNC